jgi:hypothetical protein
MIHIVLKEKQLDRNGTQLTVITNGGESYGNFKM